MVMLFDSLKEHTPTWYSSIPSKEVQLIELSMDGCEARNVIRKMAETTSVKVEKVCRVESALLWGCYQLKKQECLNRSGSVVKEMELFHATCVSNIGSITTDNLDWRRSRRCRFGQGVSFSPSAHYANRYCNNGGAMILADVLVGHSCGGCYSTTIPDGECDTTRGNCDKVYVKYNDNEFYPRYVAYYGN